MDHEYLNQREAAARLRLSPRSMERHRLEGTGPRFIRVGRRILYKIADIEEFTAAQTFRSTSEADSKRRSSTSDTGESG